MSDQTPPPAQPLPPTGGTPGTPPAGAPGTAGTGPTGTGPTGGATPPPPHAGDHDGTAGSPPPPPPKKSRKKLLIGIVAAVVVLALVAGAVVAAVLLNRPDAHTLTVTDEAGGMERSADLEETLGDQLPAAEKEFAKQLDSKESKAAYLRSAAYLQEDEKLGPNGAMVFLGGKSDGQHDPADRIAEFRKKAEGNGFETAATSAGDGGGKAACAYQTTGQKSVVCAWATNDTMGNLIPISPGYEPKQVAKLMLALRADVEKTD